MFNSADFWRSPEVASVMAALLGPLMIWSLIWKGLALWHAAKQDQKAWYIVLLVLNTVGIVEIFYLFVFAKEKLGLHSFTELSRLINKPQQAVKKPTKRRK